MALSYLDIIKRLPKTNCRECGYNSCMAFAVAVVNANVSLSSCPHIANNIAENEIEIRRVNAELSLVRELKERLKTIDIREKTRELAVDFSEKGDGFEVRMSFLNNEIVVNKDGIYLCGEEIDPRDAILVYNYLHQGGKGGLSGMWIGMESMPNSISKVATLRRYAEERIETEFAGKLDLFKSCVEKAGGKVIRQCEAHLCFIYNVLPMLPLKVNFWDKDDEEGIGAYCKILFDSHALNYLDLESLVFAAERMVETILKHCK